jgi:glycosyltransferase involved in cell wall biosynthesis
MKVLHVIPSLSLKHGGPSVAMAAIAEALLGKAIEVTIATTDDDGAGEHLEVPLEKAIRLPSGACCFYFRKDTEFYKISFSLRNWLRAHVSEFDVVHIHALFSFSSIAAARAASGRGIPFVVRPLGVLNQWGMENRRPFLKRLSLLFLEMPILRRAACIHFTTAQERAEAIAADPRIESLPFAVVPLPVPLIDSATASSALVERFPEIRGRSTVLFLSRITPKKGLELLLDAFRLIRATHPEALLMIAGDGEGTYVRSLRERAVELKIENDIVWTGFLEGPDKAAAFRAATVFVLPSYSENFGIAAAEALAHGVPSIIGQGVALSDDVREVDAGMVIRSEAPAIATALSQLLGNPGLRARLAANGQELAKRKYSPDSVGDALTNLYGSVARSPAQKS